MSKEIVMRSGHSSRTATLQFPRLRRGFTLVELMVTIAVAAILLGLAVPSFQGIALGMRLSSYSNELVASALLARSEAIKRNAVVSLCPSSDGATCSTGNWNQGWIVMCRSTDAESCDAAGLNTIVLQHRPALSTGWQVTETNGLNLISFQPVGTGATSAVLTVCRATPSNGDQERVVRISTTGRPSVTKTQAGTCV